MNDSPARVAFDHPENRGVLAYLADPARLKRSVSIAKDLRECAPDAVEDPYFRLGSHPDLLSHLWKTLTADLPQDCRWIVHGTPTLVRPDTGIIFGFCGGTMMLALRLDPEGARAAEAAGAKRVFQYPAYPNLGVPASQVDLATMGPGWVFGTLKKQERDWCRAAYEYAGQIGAAY